MFTFSWQRRAHHGPDDYVDIADYDLDLDITTDEIEAVNHLMDEVSFDLTHDELTELGVEGSTRLEDQQMAGAGATRPPTAAC